MSETKKERLIRISNDIVRLAMNSVSVNFRFMDSAVSMLQLTQYRGSVATDSKCIYYDPLHIIKLYNSGRELVPRAFLHMMLHCVFRHDLIGTLVDEELWDLACDITVENIINGLDVPAFSSPYAEKQKEIVAGLKPQVKYITAEKLYNYFLEKNIGENKLNEWASLFSADDHAIWYIRDPSAGNSAANGGNGGQNGDRQNNSGGANSDGDGNNSDNGGGLSDSRKKLEEEWKNVAEKMQTDLETFSKKQGDKAGDLMQNITAVNREKYDYTNFLKKFAVMGEAMKINDDEFDYIFYTYGLKMYDNMPLIEPLEYKEVKRIKEFVIAIDTSGSVSGELVQKFIQKTYNILMQEESFFTKINIHIIQCDAEIQEDKKITSKEEFEEYLKTMKLHGFGGTDFRPVFSYVEELRRNREFTNLKGLIYFTDGYGDFPANQPDYHTAFVFVDDDYNNPDVPVWAIKLVLQSDEI